MHCLRYSGEIGAVHALYKKREPFTPNECSNLLNLAALALF
ncbi:hypothetical protein STRMA_0928 [Streptococcus macacae NCTC 11558]|uniref:Uncharacterized protein n=1 Tax=Streptococcus macacae NCTC 11558 TaxID=764298 RepID=G5JVS2_9STRE|nr:hypothetical protein STRMA_0928 [Streptococcus macacae NCTC 11558]